METLTQWIAEHPVVTTWVTLISLIGVLITIVALILQIRDKKRRAIYYTIVSTVLIDNEISQIDGIKILFHNKEVATVGISNIKLWNGGNEILEGSDFYPEQELRIAVPKGERILGATVIEETDDTCKVDAQISDRNENEALVSFYCLEPRQGATINVYHTNVSGNEVKLIGKIKGGKVVNKSIRIEIENGEMCMSTGTHKFYFDGGFFSTGIHMARMFESFAGVSVVKRKKK